MSVREAFKEIKDKIDELQKFYTNHLKNQIAQVQNYLIRPSSAKDIDDVIPKIEETLINLKKKHDDSLVDKPEKWAEVYGDIYQFLNKDFTRFLNHVRKIFLYSDSVSGTGKIARTTLSMNLDHMEKLRDEYYEAARNFEQNEESDSDDQSSFKLKESSENDKPLGFEELLRLEKKYNTGDNPYNRELVFFQDYLARFAGEKERYPSVDSGILNKVFDLIKKNSDISGSGYKEILKDRYIHVKEFKKSAEFLKNVLNFLRKFLSNCCRQSMFPEIVYEARTVTGEKISKKIIFSLLFRNIETYMIIVKNISSDVLYDTAYYLYVMPGYVYHKEISVIINKILETRLTYKEKSQPAYSKFLADLDHFKNELDVLNDTVKEYL